MSENKFTPGPWFIVSESRYDGHNIVCQVNRENLICSDGLPSINGRHDANLIAAAPELLDALEVINNSIETTGQFRNSLMHNQIKRAIAKARGVSHE